VFCNHLPKVSIRTLVEAINSDKLRFEVAHLKTVKIVNFYCNHNLMTIYLSIIKTKQLPETFINFLTNDCLCYIHLF